jgi:hypothetical protein
MTKKEKQMKSMLNYFQIDLSNGKDESMSKKEKEVFMDKFYESFDKIVLEDVFKKIKDKMDDMRNNPEDMDGLNPFDPLGDENEEDSFLDPEDNYDEPKGMQDFMGKPSGKELPSGIPDGKQIESFLLWLRSLLYSGDHMIVVDGDGKNITNIKIMKMKGGKGK